MLAIFFYCIPENWNRLKNDLGLPEVSITSLLIQLYMLYKSKADIDDLIFINYKNWMEDTLYPFSE